MRDAFYIWFQLIRRPGGFFREFDGGRPVPLLAAIGYYALALVSIVNGQAFALDPPPEATILLQGVIFALPGAAVNAVFFGGLWFGLGSRIFRGQVAIEDMVKACGLAFYAVAPFLILLVPSSIVVSRPNVPTNFFMLLSVIGAQFGLGIWSLVIILQAIMRLNGFGWVRAVGVWAWWPAAFVVTAVALALLS